MSRLLRNLLLLALIIIGGGMSAQADDVVYKTLDFSTASQPKVDEYTKTWTATSKDGQDKWTISNFSNHNNLWTYVKCGRKNIASIATIANSNAYSSAVTKVVVTYDDVSSNPNTTYLEVSTDPNFSTVDEKVAVKTPTKGDVAYTISSPKANAYYRLTIDNPKYKKNGQIQISKLVYYISSEPGKTITSLSFGDNADKTFWKGDTEGTTFTQTATLTPAVEGAKITYGSSDANVAVVDENTGEVLVSTDKEGSATITATYAGDATHASSAASYTITVEPIYSNISELKAAYTNSDITGALRLTNAQVTYVNGKKHYLQDASGAVCVYNVSGFDYVAGDKLNGIANVTYTLYNGLPEIQSFAPIGEITKTSGDAPAPEAMTITEALNDANLCKYVIIKNVSITPVSNGNATAKDKDGNSIAVYKSGTTFVAGDYDLTGVNSIHTTKQIEFISYAPDFTIDENVNSNAITAGENGTVTIDRTFNANAWNTLVLPFDVSANDLPDKFGHDAKFATYTGTSKNNDGTYTLNFQSVSALTANTPVFVWGANDEGIYQFSGVKVVKADPTSTPSDAAFSFTGSYDKTTLKAGDWFISSDNKFYRALGSETMKPMRAVFRPVTAAAAKGLSFSIDGGEATGISAITADGSIVVNDNAPMYNLAGQRVSKSYKGVVIQNGKKYIK